MQTAGALEKRDVEPNEKAEDSPMVGEREALAASESGVAKGDFGTGSVEAEERHVGDGAEAEFMLESSAVCPHCLEDIDKIQIVRMLRTKVNFVSSLPRRGQLLICPKCRIALAGALGGLI